MIFKLQRAILPPDGPVLAYNETRAIVVTLPMSRGLDTLFAGKLKVYVNAEVVTGEDRRAKLAIVGQVAAQPW